MIAEFHFLRIPEFFIFKKFGRQKPCRTTLRLVEATSTHGLLVGLRMTVAPFSPMISFDSICLWQSIFIK